MPVHTPAALQEANEGASVLVWPLWAGNDKPRRDCSGRGCGVRWLGGLVAGKASVAAD